MAQHVVEVLEAVEAEHQQRCRPWPFARYLDHRVEPGVKRRSVRKPGKHVVFRKIPNALGFALSDRNVTQHRAILHLIGALPAGKTCLDRKHLAVLAAAVEFHDQAAGQPRSGARLLAP